MNIFKEICKALLDEITHESPATCLAREALLSDDSPSKPTAKELQNLWQICNSPSVFAHAVLARWGRPAPPAADDSKLRDAALLALTTLEGWSNYNHWLWPISTMEQSKRGTVKALAALRTALKLEGQQ